MSRQEEERKVSPADDESDYSSIPFTLSGEDAVEDDHNHPELALLQQSEEESNHRNKSASGKTRVNDNDETDGDDMSVNSISTQPGGISELSPSDNGLEMVEEADGMNQAAAVPDNTTSAQEKSTKPIGIGKICGNGEKESPIEMFSDDEDDSDEDIPQLREITKERDDTDQSDEDDEYNRKMDAREGGVSPAAMQTSQASYMRQHRRGRPKKNSAASISIDDEDDRNMCAEERKTQPSSVRRSSRTRKPPDLFIRHQKVEEPTRKRKRRVDLTEDAIQDARPTATPLAAAAAQTTQKRSMRKGTQKHRPRIHKQRTESENTGKKGFIGDGYWTVEKVWVAGSEKSEKVAGSEKREKNRYLNICVGGKVTRSIQTNGGQRRVSVKGCFRQPSNNFQARTLELMRLVRRKTRRKTQLIRVTTILSSDMRKMSAKPLMAEDP
jgi:hypothetical protein